MMANAEPNYTKLNSTVNYYRISIVNLNQNTFSSLGNETSGGADKKPCFCFISLVQEKSLKPNNVAFSKPYRTAVYLNCTNRFTVSVLSSMQHVSQNFA
jgi:hypothetical protein